MARSRLYNTFLLLGAVMVADKASAQLSVNTTFTPAELVNDMLVGQGVTVSNLTFNGAPANTLNDQIGAFYGSGSNIGLNDGVVLGTGRVVGVSGSNQNSSLTLPPSAPVNVADPDLAFIENQQRCVAVLEFDFVPTGDSISFRFVFGSEEYPEYVCSQYNDAFGFFLSGPGINGPYTNNAINLGVLPNSTIPIAINTVNSGSPGVLGGGASGCSASDPNWQLNSDYYIDNDGGTSVELDGFTVPIRTGAAVQCGQTYHIKIAIAHAGDASLDSAVLIEGGSFSSNSSITASVTVPQGDGTLTEGCGEALVTIQVPTSSTDANIQLDYRGLNIDANDLIGNIASVVIPTGSTSITFPLSAVSDEQQEGDETLTIIATWVADCGFTVSDSVSIVLLEYVPMEIISADLYLACDLDSAALEASVIGGLGVASISWATGDTGDLTYVPGLENGTYEVTATDECPRTVSMTVNVNAGCSISIPNIITPNNDGVNDAWVIDGNFRQLPQVTVFNRWGQIVFESASYNNNWQAPGVPDGTYFYEVISDRSDSHLTGTLTILSNGRP
jgi:gliding motility-associated-like protein